ncbi:MAG: response regulator [Ignavibacteria bacterium GWB2_35_6b]|nr:MAG: response regulator [Ignavibacteria bacterium GWB2_35_6b]
MDVKKVKRDISADLTEHKITVLLVDDQAIIGEAVRRMLAEEKDINFNFCQDPTKAIETANKLEPTVILQDLVMPDIDGLLLVKYYRANKSTSNIPLIVLSAKEDPKIKAEAFSLGANDYLVKLPDKVELIARIRYHSKGYINLLQRNEAYEAMLESQKLLSEEIAEAAAYVRSILPDTLTGEITTAWKFIPSTSLGGDAFGYHWIDENNFAMYLLDVCGHGVGAALLSISAMNVLRSGSLANTNFLEPASVLFSINNAFPMEQQNNKFFTIWYGVYNRQTRELKYSSGGHPPSILIHGKNENEKETLELRNKNLAIGYLPGFEFKSGSVIVEKFNKLFLYSDGVFEIKKPDGEMMQAVEFVELVSKLPAEQNNVDVIHDTIRKIKGNDEPFDDDFSILELTFK